MIIKYSKKENTEGFFVTEGINCVRTSKSGKAYSFLITDKSLITLVGKDGKEFKLTGKDLINKLF